MSTTTTFQSHTSWYTFTIIVVERAVRQGQGNPDYAQGLGPGGRDPEEHPKTD
jgi:hypothetical protein